MARPEPMNTTPAHSKAKVSLFFSDRIYVAGEHVTGKIELECKAERGLGIADIKVELFAIQELTSRDHSATSTFLHLTRYFQGEGLPPSNAVYAHPLPDSEDILPAGYHEARKGRTTFFFRFPLPPSSPASIDFNKGLAKLKYEVRASAGISWRSELQRVMERKEVAIVEMPVSNVDAEQVVLSENGKFWTQGRLLSPYVVAGKTSCLELFVKNHTERPTTSLSLSLTRHLQIPNLSQPHQTLQAADTFFDSPFEGPEYIVQPGTEGVANLVFEVPRLALGVRAGKLDPGEESSRREVDSIFGLQLLLEAKIGMGPGKKDVVLSIPISVTHPASLRMLPPSPTSGPEFSPPLDRVASPPYPPTSPYRAISPYQYPYSGPALEYYSGYMSPPLSPPPSQPMWSPPPIEQYIYYPPPPSIYQLRPASADPYVGQQMPIVPIPPLVNPHEDEQSPRTPVESILERPNAEEGELGKGERASRISAHLRLSSRNRSVSPQSHRFPQPPLVPVDAFPATPRTIPAPQAGHATPLAVITSHLNTSPKTETPVHSPRPILSPKHSFSADRGTVKSEHVADLERMAAEEEAGEETEKVASPGQLNKTLPSPPPPSKLRPPSNEQVPFPPEPILHPVNDQRRLMPDSWKRGSGLDALEQKLLDQVGTRKPDATPRADVRDVISHPISIPSHSNRDLDPLNDSAISSLSLGHMPDEPSKYPLDHGIEALAVENPLPVKEERKPSPRAHGHDRTRRVDKGQLKKAATGRVAQWLGGIMPSANPPPATASPPDDVRPGPGADATADVDDAPEPNDIDPHPLLRSPMDAPKEVESAQQAEAIPERSSGFVLHNVDESGPMTADKSPRRVETKASPKTQETSPISARFDASPLKPVLRRFALPEKGGLAEAKYDVRSARGGRGGKVASVGAIWASLAAQEETKPATNVMNGTSESKRGEFNPVFRQPRPKPALSNDVKNQPPQMTPPHSGGQRKPTDTAASKMNMGDLTSRRARMIKSPSVPAIISSSLATPILSSTASLARPVHSQPRNSAYPNQDHNHVYPRNTTFGDLETVKAGPNGDTKAIEGKATSAKSPPPVDLAFGQARLKDLIRKYQQGFGP